MEHANLLQGLGFSEYFVKAVDNLLITSSRVASLPKHEAQRKCERLYKKLADIQNTYNGAQSDEERAELKEQFKGTKELWQQAESKRFYVNKEYMASCAKNCGILNKLETIIGTQDPLRPPSFSLRNDIERLKMLDKKLEIPAAEYKQANTLRYEMVGKLPNTTENDALPDIAKIVEKASAADENRNAVEDEIRSALEEICRPEILDETAELAELPQSPTLYTELFNQVKSPSFFQSGAKDNEKEKAQDPEPSNRFKK